MSKILVRNKEKLNTARVGQEKFCHKVVKSTLTIETLGSSNKRIAKKKNVVSDLDFFSILGDT